MQLYVYRASANMSGVPYASVLRASVEASNRVPGLSAPNRPASIVSHSGAVLGAVLIGVVPFGGVYNFGGVFAGHSLGGVRLALGHLAGLAVRGFPSLDELGYGEPAVRVEKLVQFLGRVLPGDRLATAPERLLADTGLDAVLAEQVAPANGVCGEVLGVLGDLVFVANRVAAGLLALPLDLGAFAAGHLFDAGDDLGVVGADGEDVAQFRVREVPQLSGLHIYILASLVRVVNLYLYIPCEQGKLFTFRGSRGYGWHPAAPPASTSAPR